MKLGILTFHRPCNFGANLQAFATVRYFQSLGHEVKVIDYVREADRNYQFVVASKQIEAHVEFIITRLPLTDQVSDEEGLRSVVRKEAFDAILIGSDAVWRKPQDNNIYFAQWLFENPQLSSVPVASISPSHMGDGFQSCSKEQTDSIRKCLEQFKYVAVRDSWTRDVINRDIFGGDKYIQNITPDPVFKLPKLLNDMEWDNRGHSSQKYILATFEKDWSKSPKRGWLRRLWFNLFKKLANKAGYELIELPIPEGKSGLSFDDCIDYPIDPIQWFLWIQNARCFIGIRFHAIVSCIACGTPFYSIDSYCDNSFKNSLLTMFGFRKLARANDQRSKIRNLLFDTKFENYRTGDCIEFENPKRILHQILECSKVDIQKLGDLCRVRFKSNMQDLIASICHETN